jgi:hypothetical protein
MAHVQAPPRRKPGTKAPVAVWAVLAVTGAAALAALGVAVTVGDPGRLGRGLLATLGAVVVVGVASGWVRVALAVRHPDAPPADAPSADTSAADGPPAGGPSPGTPAAGGPAPETPPAGAAGPGAVPPVDNGFGGPGTIE